MIAIRSFETTDTSDCATLISQVFSTFNKSEGTVEAVNRYANYYNPENTTITELESNFARTPNFFVAVDGNKIVGLIRGTAERIINLFVDGTYHNQGIGKKLITEFEKQVQKQNSKLINVRASLYAVPFYQRVGYKKTTGIRNFRGLKVQPMRKVL